MMKVAKESKKMGRPGLYTEELAEAICEQIATTSKGMKAICADLDISVITVLCWLSEGHRNYKEDFAKIYARAKEMQAEMLADEILQIADDGSNDTYTDEEGREKTDHDVIARSRLRVDSRKWIASKLKPKKYGDKMDVTSDGEKIAPIIWQETKTYDSNGKADESS